MAQRFQLVGLIISFFLSGVPKSYSNVIKNDTIPASEEFSFFVSNRGSDSNDGRSASSPKLSISSIEPLMTNISAAGSGASLNLEENSIFREQFDPAQINLQVNSFGSKDPKQFAKITGMDVIDQWTSMTSFSNVYQHILKHSIELSGPEYSYIMVAEIDTILEKTHPVSAVKYLALAPNIESCNNTPGTYYTAPLSTNPATVSIHATEGSPGKNKYRYEVATRNYNINGFNTDNATYKNLYLQTSGQGYGMLSAGRNSTVRNVIFQGGGTHHTVIKSGQIDSCLFLPGPKGLRDRIAAVFYNTEGKDANNKITNTIFVNTPSAVYTHTIGVVNHKSLLLDKVYAFGDSTDATNGLSANDTDSIEVMNCYVEDYPTGWWYGGGTKINIKNSIFRRTNQSAIMAISKSDVIGEFKIDNVLIETNGNDNNQNLANGWTAFGIRAPYNNVNLDISNTIIHGFSTWHELNNNTVNAIQCAGQLKAHHNIYICDVNDISGMHMYNANNSGGKGSSTNVSSDYNAYILLRGSKFHWMVNPNVNTDQNVVALSEWQNLTGQDKNSILIDLRSNPLGLNAIFVDPANGNWTLTHTPEAESIRNISAGMTVPPLFYPKRPTIKNIGSPFKTPGGASTLSGMMKSESESVIQWQTFNETDFSSFVIEYSLDGIHFFEAGSIKAFNDDMNHNYDFSTTHLNTDSVFFRLNAFDTDSTKFFSSVIRLNGNFSEELKITVYPNPFQQTVTVKHPRRETGEIFVYDYSGRFIKMVSVQSRSSKTRVSLPNLSSGRYFVQWKSGREKLSGSIVK